MPAARVMPLRARRTVLPLILAVGLLATAVPAASAVPSGSYKGGDIEFRVSNNRISKVSVLSVHTCQAVGTGDFFNELQRFTPAGGFRISGGSRFSGSRYVIRVNDYFDIRFAWVGRFRNGKLRARIQTAYKYYRYYADAGTVLTSCFSDKVFTAKRRR